ncbi:MAG: D-glycero-alpha-D-manno-heptose-1,7-bisphosphate 7-phosphatase [Roseiflexaceae bacterium]
MQRRAIFLDRDGTLVHPRHYPSRPAELQLYDDIGAGLRFLQQAGFQLIVITNQSGLAHGYFSAADLAAMHEHLASELASLEVRLDGVYHCPHHPDGVVPELSIVCDCRKPQPGLLLRAAADRRVDLRRSWFVGDILDDVEAGKRAGCRTVLVDLGTEPSPPIPLRQPDFVARDTPHALAIIVAVERLGPPLSTTYLPPRWREHLSGEHDGAPHKLSEIER